MKYLAVAVMSLAFATGVQADVLYDSTADRAGAGVGVSSDGPLANSFSTGSLPPLTFNDVQLSLDIVDLDTKIGKSITVNLLGTTGGNTPGALIQQLGVIDDSDPALSGAFGLYNLPVTLLSPLDPTTRYWIELTTSTDSGINWEFENSDAGIGVAGEWSATKDGVFANAPCVRFLVAPRAFSRSELGKLEEVAKSWGAKGLAYVVVDEGGEVRSPIAKFFSEREQQAFSAPPGSTVLFAAGSEAEVARVLGGLRIHLGRELAVSE